MAPLSLPPDVLERLRQANIKRLSSERASDFVLDMDDGDERNDDDEESGIISQMKENGFAKSFCEFTLDFVGKLKKEGGKPLPPSDAVILAKQGFSMGNCGNLVKIVRSMDDHLVKTRKFSMRMNQIAALLTLLFGSSEEVCCKASFVKHFHRHYIPRHYLLQPNQ